MLSRIDLVAQQIAIAAGQALPFTQEEITLDGWAMMCRVRANDPWLDFMPTPGKLEQVRLPGGPQVRVDTYVYPHCRVPVEFGPLLANLTVWGEDRERCLRRLKRSLEDFTISGTPTNLPALQRIVDSPAFSEGTYSTAFKMSALEQADTNDTGHLARLAVAAAAFYLQRTQLVSPESPQRLQGGWHRSSRQLPR
jgi:acetyl/propionyl-CoA carboxylase alpha subunit